MSHRKASVFVSGVGGDICCPFLDVNGKLCAVKQNTGAVISINSVGNTQNIVNTQGQPSGAVYSPDGALYIADFAQSAVLAVQQDNSTELIVGVYEDKPLKGPNSIAVNNGNIFFTDSGAFGETGLHSATGSVFAITNSASGQILKPVSLSNLAYPTGIAVTNDGKFMYVAEMMTNRVLRFFQQPHGVYHGSVFYQLSGAVGPSSLAVGPDGTLYIGHYDVRESNASEGSVYVVSSAGKLVGTIGVPGGSEISGLALSKDGVLYITEKSSSSVYKIDV